MEALSPRSANIQVKPKVIRQKELAVEEAKKIEAIKKAQKEKEYAPAPPEWVLQPPINGGGLAEKFQTGKCIGRGGFAICYEGWLRNKKQGAEKSLYALKVVKANMSQKKMEEKVRLGLRFYAMLSLTASQFRTELQIHAKMRHPNIVEFHRAFTFKESTYVVLEMCSNGSIMDMVKKRRCLSLPEVRRYSVQLCGAIKYMHARNVIHRDLKMGNLFLDHHMNLKVGDFGLAAVLVSPKEYARGLYEDAKIRRITLCGTPNYIAPEILEKGKGHNYKADVWAIGVTVYAFEVFVRATYANCLRFAMISGQPPFQSASQNEIYRRARALEYDWPQKDRHLNDIPEEAKDLVGRILQVEDEERPDPDEVVGHPFFSMHGGNALPLIMDETMTRQTPFFLDIKARPRGDVMHKGTERLSLTTLARQCGVGQLSGQEEPLPAVGEDINIPLFGQCRKEEASGKGPVVPLPKDMVYISKFLSTSLQAADTIASNPIDLDDGAHYAVRSQPSPEKAVHYLMPERPRRAPVPSHAATLRAAHVGTRAKQSTVGSERDILSSTTLRSHGPASTGNATMRRQRGLLNEFPVRPAVNTTNAAGLEAKTLARNARATRAKKLHILEDDQQRVPLEGLKVDQPLTKDQRIDEARTDPAAKRRAMSARPRAHTASDMQKEMAEPAEKPRKDSLEITAARTQKTSDSPKTGSSLIGPDEVFECLPRTKPDDVLRQLKRLHKELETCLKDFADGKDHNDVQNLDVDSERLKNRPYVVKWVDYTNRFGIGYILDNGTVGCVFKGDDSSFPTCVVVAGAESHLQNRKVSGYAEKHQIIPSKSSSIQFIENCNEDGLKRVLVQPSIYQLKVTDGVAEKLRPGADIHDYEKCKKLCLWDKFGKYMTQNLAKVDEGDLEPLNEEPSSSKSRRNNVAGPFVKFYQRLGNVGIWGFGDGSFQFNFPDHTKLIISASGEWLDFYHLPIPAVQSIRTGSVLDPHALVERSVLSYPTNVMLSGNYKNHDFEELIAENELSVKLTFVHLVVGLWAKEGGLGCMGRKKGVKWDGMTEKGGKLVWVTVGAKGGDGRYEIPAKGA